MTNANSPESFVISSESGAAFLFDDLYLATDGGANINYTITGYSASLTPLWSTGTGGFTGVLQGPHSSCPAGYSAGSYSLCYLEIDAPANEPAATYVKVSISAATIADPGVYIDNVTLTSTPEPSGLLLLGTGLAGACGVMYRKRRASIA